MFDSRRDKYVLATLLNPCFKGRIETMLSPYAGTDCWKDTVINNSAGGHTIMHLLFSLILPLSSPRPSISHKAKDAQVPGTSQSAKEEITAIPIVLGASIINSEWGSTIPEKSIWLYHWKNLSMSWEPLHLSGNEKLTPKNICSSSDKNSFRKVLKPVL